MSFQTWSETNHDAHRELRPDFGLRTFDEISKEERKIIWQHLLAFFFENEPVNDRARGYGTYYVFYGDQFEKDRKQARVTSAILVLTKRFKAKNYAPNFLVDFSDHSACLDFFKIFLNQNEPVVIELLSLYAKAIIDEDKYHLSRDANESDKTYQKRKAEWDWEAFDTFSDRLNDVFSHFGLNYILTRASFVSRIDKKIIDDVYTPVLSSLSNIRWKEVNSLLTESFAEYRKNNPEGFSTCVTKTVTAVQAFLQILVNGKTGIGTISKLIPVAQSKGLISSDTFTTTVFKDIESTLMRERQDTSDAHPRKEYANEKNARLVLNLAMVFFQHSLA